MTRNLSVFLDVLRLSAALMVLIGHAAEVFGIPLPDLIAHSAKEGVAIFFVLSGFVIAHVTARKEPDWRSYARARALRMYSVIPLAIAVLLLCHAIGSHLDPATYGIGVPATQHVSGGAAGSPPNWVGVVRYLTFSNEVWFDTAMIATGAPFWSLGFEVAYYVAFAVLFYAPGGWRWGLGILWLTLCGPRIALAFPLWLLGVGSYHLVQRGTRLSSAAGWPLLALVACGALAWRKWAAWASVPLFEWPDARTLVLSTGYYLVLGSLVAAAIVTFAAGTSAKTVWPAWFERIVRYFAGASFTLYIMHLPVMVLVAAVWPNSRESAPAGLLATMVTIIAMLVMAELGERRKAAYGRFFAVFTTMFPVRKTIPHSA